MALGGLSANIIDKVTKSMVLNRRCKSEEEALWELALSAVRRKTALYRRRIRSLERKYIADFDAFTLRLSGCATPAQEEDWMAWRIAQDMLYDWQQTYQDLRHAKPH